MQVPAQFQYEKATSVEHAVRLLGKYGPESRIVAGGHSLLPMMKLRLAQPEALIDINDLEELARISVEEHMLCIGALVRHAQLLASAVAGEHFPIFHDAERVIADPVVRNRGTIGGSLCQADPSEDLSAVFAAVRGEAVIRGPDGQRVVGVREFFAGPYQTVLGDEEILTQLRVPIRSSASAYEKVERRAGDWATAAAGAELLLEGDQVAAAGIGLTSVGATNFHAPEAEEFLVGGPAGDARFDQAGAVAAEHCSPVADQRGPVDYKRHLAATLVTRALMRARTRWYGQHSAHERES
ncbi:MAG TPA: xanthine dehydrogenase family protein subunit M [Amycolatopsis sp.]|nr:xanthine dehydrogenase family protein subunit M [Amycolatopsis sp.]